MDVISHWFWGMAVTHGKIKGRFSGAMGVIPDLMAFLPVMIISIFTGHRNPSVDDTTTTEDFHPLSWEIYQWSHSAITVLVCFLATWLYLEKYGTPKFLNRFYLATMSAKKQAFLIWLPWLLNIITDIPSHTAQFFPTPVFHPISDWKYDGTRWSTPSVWFTNLGILLFVWAIMIVLERRRKASYQILAE